MIRRRRPRFPSLPLACSFLKRTADSPTRGKPQAYARTEAWSWSPAAARQARDTEGLIAHTSTLRCQQGSRTVPAAFTGLRSHLTYSLYWSKTLLSLLTWCFMLAADTR
jgi:hypothetical protein